MTQFLSTIVVYLLYLFSGIVGLHDLLDGEAANRALFQPRHLALQANAPVAAGDADSVDLILEADGARILHVADLLALVLIKSRFEATGRTHNWLAHRSRLELVQHLLLLVQHALIAAWIDQGIGKLVLKCIDIGIRIPLEQRILVSLRILHPRHQQVHIKLGHTLILYKVLHVRVLVAHLSGLLNEFLLQVGKVLVRLLAGGSLATHRFVG